MVSGGNQILWCLSGTDLKCGAIGELGCSWPLTAGEKKVLRAAASVQAGKLSIFG